VLARVPAVTVKVPAPVTETFIEFKFILPDPLKLMLPTEVRLPDGSILVPPVIERVVPAVKVPAPA
jgi:hypothetical protein